VSALLAPQFQARLLLHEPMSRHTSWRVGGPAEYFFTPHDRDDLSAFLRELPAATPVFWLGLGSNLLVRDGGLRGVVIATQGAFMRLERRSETHIYSECSVPCTRLARQAVKWGLSEGEFFSGIPGLLGGALAMNAGAYGGETWRQVVSVEVINRSGEQRTRLLAEYHPAYRQVQCPANDEWYLAAELQFNRQAPDEINRMHELRDRRKASQPLGAWSCGSVFTNPPGDHAARLIEAAGLKGFRIGGAVVSTKHANFIINEGAATATDLENMIRHVQAAVQQKHGIALHPEVRIVGEMAQ
jgi:UDP-N-acetylmuramate dehydrogenase